MYMRFFDLNFGHYLGLSHYGDTVDGAAFNQFWCTEWIMSVWKWARMRMN